MESQYRFELGKYRVGKLIYSQGLNGDFYDGYEEEKNQRTGKINKLSYFFRFGPAKILTDQVSVGFMSDYVLKQVGSYRNGMNMCIVYQAPYQYQNLHEYVEKHNGPLPEEDVISFMYMMLRYMCDLKENMYLSSTISPENIFLFHEGSNHKLLRFLGSSKTFEIPPQCSFLRPIQFFTPCISPEIACGGNGRINSQSDMFGFGGISYFLMTKHYPFDNNKNQEITKEAIKNHMGPFNKQIIGPYNGKLKSIVEKCLNGDYCQRPKPHDLIKESVLNRSPYDDIRLLIYVTPSIKWIPRKDIYSGDSSSYVNISVTGKVRNRVSDTGILIETELLDPNRSLEEDHTVPYDWVVPCTAIADPELMNKQYLFGGVLPLFENCLVLEGPQWDEFDHGTNNQYFPGRVENVLSNNDQYNLVTIEWSSVDRFFRYKYGGLEDRFEIIPAFPPLYHGLHVMSRSSYRGTPFKGVVHQILEGREKFKIQTSDGNLLDISYGEAFNDPRINGGADAINYSFDVEIDPKFHKINYKRCKTVDQFLELVKMKYSQILPSQDDQSHDPRKTIFDDFHKFMYNKPKSLQQGYFVKNTQHSAPPHDFYRIIDLSSDPVLKRYYSNSVTQVILSSTEGLIQCSYGNLKYPPKCIGDKVSVNSDRSEGTVERICCDPSQSDKTWEYLIIKIKSENTFRCYKFNELTIISSGK